MPWERSHNSDADDDIGAVDDDPIRRIRMTLKSPQPRRIALGAAALLAAALALPLGAAGAAAGEVALPGSTLYVNPFSTTLEAGQALSGQSRADAQLLGSIPS